MKLPLLALMMGSIWLLMLQVPSEFLVSDAPFDKRGLSKPSNSLHPNFHSVDNSKFQERDFRVPDIDQAYDPSLERMWQCQNQDRSSKKLVFVHVFKTAGSTIRALLQAYSHSCNAGLAIVVSCTSLAMDSLGSSTPWRNGYGRREGNQCKLKKAFGRGQSDLDIPSDESITTTFLEHHIDILGGHLPIGSDIGWTDDTGKQVDVQYLVFLRDATRKYVSGILFKNPKLSLEQIVPKIKTFVRNERSNDKYYEKYSSYLISPEQIEEFSDRGMELNRQQRVNLTMLNLLQSDVIVGIVERMSESLELMKHTMDDDDKLTSMFEFFGMKDKNGNIQKQEVNKSKLSTTAVLVELEKDTEFIKILREYVKYDDRIYKFALELHKRQYDAIKLVQRQRSEEG